MAQGFGHNSGDTEKDLDEADVEKEAEEELKGKTLKELLALGQEELLRSLLVRVKARTATHQEQAILRNMLRDSGQVITPDPPGYNPERDSKQEPLPTLSDPDYDQ